MWPSTLEIRPLSVAHRGALGLHLMTLTAEDRYARFGLTLSDEAVLNWVARLCWQEQQWWGAWMPHDADLGLLGSLQLSATSQTGDWELGLTVVPLLRNQGLGTLLLGTALNQLPQVRRIVCQHGHPAVEAMLRRLGHRLVRPC
jgi:GNAT superfamily N-acetyltransferase